MKKLLLALLALCLTTSLFAFSSCGKKDDPSVITVGASPTPHAEILNVVKEELKKQGYTLKIVEFNDYILPNEGVESGELLANYFQHQPYLDDYNKNNGTHITSVASVHYEPFALYGAAAYPTLSALKSAVDGGTKVKIAIPNDGSNEARALFLLQENGFLTLKAGTGFTATKQDIATCPQNLEIVEMEAGLLPNTVKGKDVAAAVINGNYAISSGLSIKNALAKEKNDSAAATTYANIIAVKQGNENDPRVKALVSALKSQAVKNYIAATYGGGVVALF